MRKLFLILIIGILSGCSTIMRDNTQTVPIKSNVDKVNVKLINRRGQTVIESQTPLSASLKTSQEGYFNPEKYTIEATKEGYKPLKIVMDWHVSKWYSIGNLGFGSIIGYLIVDPITGDMYYLDEEINLNLTPTE